MFEEETVEKAADLDERVVLAKDSESEAEKLILDYTPFLRSRAARYSLQDKEDLRDALFSVAMSAFYEAIQSYDDEKGHFFPFANRVIRARIIDYIRTSSKHEGRTVPLETDDDELRSAQSSAINMISMRNYDEERRRERLAEEIEQFKHELASWGITMEALVRASPKHKELRRTYDGVIAAVAGNPDIMQTIHLKRYFPVNSISKLTGLPQKKLERARIYVLAALVIKTGDYEQLSGYLGDRR